jgi:hypothetical protein
VDGAEGPSQHDGSILPLPADRRPGAAGAVAEGQHPLGPVDELDHPCPEDGPRLLVQLGLGDVQSLAARGLGRVAVVSGDLHRAVELLADAPRRCRRLPDSYRWVEAYALGALADVAVAAGLEEAGPAIAELEAIASRHGMRELMVTAAILRARRGEAGALDTARLMVSELDNPVLHEQVATAGAPA